jgi:hypothetical protein
MRYVHESSPVAAARDSRTDPFGRPFRGARRIATARLCVWRQLVEEYEPLAKSLEWQLAGLHWTREGVLPFIDRHVPYLVNNNGRVSADAAALLFASCLESGARRERISVLELGAGTGLFARYFLDEFRLLCEREFETSTSGWPTM